MPRLFRREADRADGPARVEARLRQAAEHASKGSALLEAGDAAAALAHQELAVELSPRDAHLRFGLARALEMNGEPEGAAREYREAIALDPRLAAAHCNLGLALAEIGRIEEAVASLVRATELDPGNGAYRANLRVIATRGVPMWHFSMLNDAARNSAYEAAIARALRPGDLVFEIGTGSGLLAMMAARAGAGHVFTCEGVPALAMKAREIVRRNGFEQRITVTGKRSGEVRVPEDLPRRADLLLSEIVSTDLIGEGLLQSVEDAKARLLAPGARVVPRRAAVMGRLVRAVGLDEAASVGRVAGFDLAAFNDFKPLKVHGAEAPLSFELLTAPFEIFTFDFESGSRFPEARKCIDVQALRAGRCDGVLQWFALDLAEGVRYENAPGEDGSVRREGHWQQVLHPFEKPLEVAAGQAVSLAAVHNRSNLMFYPGDAP